MSCRTKRPGALEIERLRIDQPRFFRSSPNSSVDNINRARKLSEGKLRPYRSSTTAVFDPLRKPHLLVARRKHSARCRCSADACLSAKGAVATRRDVGAGPTIPDDNKAFST